ncbi:hypothetical protein [Agromyces sp. ZXT2-6]|uniref:hypothetical protein n=1 Tax=Agromyces sp. ZXT2-6 TaxID=3461153 RepID=UPI004054F5FF
MSAGVPLPVALGELRDGLEHPALSRALDQVLGALDRGAPLAAVLRAQAGDARAEAKRSIIELAGRKEIAMLAPITKGLNCLLALRSPDVLDYARDLNGLREIGVRTSREVM